MSPVEQGISQVKIALQTSHIINKFSVEENVDSERPRVDVRMKCVNVLDDVSEMTRMMRVTRQKIPGNYMVKIRIDTVL